MSETSSGVGNAMGFRPVTISDKLVAVSRVFLDTAASTSLIGKNVLEGENGRIVSIQPCITKGGHYLGKIEKLYLHTYNLQMKNNYTIAGNIIPTVK